VAKSPDSKAASNRVAKSPDSKAAASKAVSRNKSGKSS
jgi:hypothetical protein